MPVKGASFPARKAFFSPKKNKYHSKRATWDNISFDSQMEGSWYLILKSYQESGEVNFFLRQPSFDLGAGVTYRADFLVFFRSGLVEVMDVKGMETDLFKVKHKLLEAKYPFQLKIITKENLKKPQDYFIGK